MFSILEERNVTWKVCSDISEHVWITVKVKVNWFSFITKMFDKAILKQWLGFCCRQSIIRVDFNKFQSMVSNEF